MIFAVRVVLFGRVVQHHGEQAAVVILGPGRIVRGAYRHEKRGCGFDERRLMPEPALIWRIVHARP